ncbi:MAG: purine-cytosine permease family protein [Actinomycetota bacterium]
MSGILDRAREVLERGEPSHGIRPVPPQARELTGRDLAVLWGDLSVGLLVLVTGALLVPALALPRALLAIGLGAVLGSLPLALAARAGQREGVPGMMLFRAALGARGSWVPSALNLLQLVGWTAVEFWAMAGVANVASREFLGVDAFHGWLAVVAIVCTGFAVGGPVLVVRRWLERFGVPVLVLATAFIKRRVVAGGGIAAAWSAPGTGGLPFWLAVDLVIVMPVSWLPLVADYTRFARPDARAAAGTFAGSTIGTAWFYVLGALLVLTAGAVPDVAGVGGALLAVAGGPLLLLAILVGETDNAFANLYSSVVSVQNLAPRTPRRALTVAFGVLAFLLASTFSVERYEVFLLLIGSVFVPLFGAFAADWAVRARGSYGEAALFGGPAFRPLALVPIVAGFVLYHWSVPTGPTGWVAGVEAIATSLGLPFPLFGSALGASLPSFALAFVLSLALPRR